MSIKIHILSDGFKSPNARAFLFPLLMHQSALATKNITLRFFNVEHRSLCECDLLLVDSKFFRGPKRGAADYIVARLEKWRARQNNLLWFDTTDSAGWLFEGALLTTKAYYKNQMLRDKSLYLKPMYGRRLPSHFYHSHEGIVDTNPYNAPQVQNPESLKRLHVSWNSGIANYSLHGPRHSSAYSLIKWKTFLNWPTQVANPYSERATDVSCRFGITYDKATISYQRQAIHRILNRKIPTNKVKRAAYIRELEASRIVVSPFGLGEITLKDFEVFLSGAMLLKPDMSHMETWPDLFLDGITMKTFHWNLDDLEHQIEILIADQETCVKIAAEGQKRYRQYLNNGPGQEVFVSRFLSIIEHGLT